jgi:hypothetical protein
VRENFDALRDGEKYYFSGRENEVFGSKRPMGTKGGKQFLDITV